MPQPRWYIEQLAAKAEEAEKARLHGKEDAVILQIALGRQAGVGDAVNRLLKNSDFVEIRRIVEMHAAQQEKIARASCPGPNEAFGLICWGNGFMAFFNFLDRLVSEGRVAHENLCALQAAEAEKINEEG